MDRLRFVLASRGIRNAAARAGQVASRFGVSAGRMEARLLSYVDMLEEYGVRPSFPVTASVLDRNPQVVRRLSDRGAEFCVHGLVHNDLSDLEFDVQRSQINRACAIFAKHGTEFRGFRSPYLRYNDDTLRAVAEAGFEYDSNLPFYWGPLDELRQLTRSQAEGLERGLRFYRPAGYPQTRSLPVRLGSLVEIPVSLPDDEMLLDRMQLPPSAIGRVWREVAEMAVERGDLLTLQVHPERAGILQRNIRSLLDFASSGARFWMATMGEIASWWKSRLEGRVEVSTLGVGRHRVSYSGPDRTRLRVVRPDGGTSTSTDRDFVVCSDRRPVVGLDPDAPSALRDYLRQMGYFFELTRDRNLCAVHLESSADPSSVAARLTAAGCPLVSECVWPDGFRAALAVTGDIDCLTLGDFLRRFSGG